jgi:hypothetical protein
MRYLFVFVTSLFHFINLSAYAREFSVNQIYASLDTIDYFIRNKDFEEGLNVAKKTIYEAHKSNMQNVSDLSYVYDKKADCEEALNLTDDLEVTLRGNVEIRENSLSPNDIMLAFSCSRLAFLLERKGNYEESVFYNEKASAIFKSLNEDKLYSGSVLSIARNYEKWSDSDDLEYSFKHRDLSGSSKSLLEFSIEYYLKALELEEDPHFNYSSIHHSIASSFEKLKDYKKAIFHYLLELKHDPEDSRNLKGITLDRISVLYSRLNDEKKSLEFARDALNYYKKKATSDKELSELHMNLANKILSFLSNPFEQSKLADQYFYHMELAHALDKSSTEVAFNLSHMYTKHDRVLESIKFL